MAVFTIFNHGTDVDHNQKNHNITMLYKSVLRQTGDGSVMYTDGVGSKQSVKDDFLSLNNSGLAAAVGGVTFGYGIDRAVSSALEWVAKRKPVIDLLNICGYSRGAVASFKQAAAMFKRKALELDQIPVRIFAIDPVPGCMGKLNSHVYRDIELNSNVKECMIILAENERRKIFRPALPPVLDQANTALRCDSMPGNHKGIVEQDADVDAPLLIYDLARNFLNWPNQTFFPRPATKFCMTDNPMGEDEILGRYSKIMLGFDEYIKMGQVLKNWKKGGLENLISSGGFTKNRVVRMKTENKNTGFAKDDWHAGTVTLSCSKGGVTKKRFFANQHHRDIFRKRLLGASLILEPLEQQNYSNISAISVVRVFNAVATLRSEWATYVHEHVDKFFGFYRVG
jgi:hypothetical protein